MLIRRLVFSALAISGLLVELAACGPQTTPLLPATPTAAPSGATSEPEQPTVAPTTGTPIQPARGASLSAGVVSEKGPWLVFSSDDALWVASADGSGASQLVGGFSRVTAPVAAPSGGRAAAVTARAHGDSGLELYLLSLTSGDIETITPLTSPATTIDPNVENLGGSPNVEIARAILDVPSLAWSPDGKKLAFIGAMKGSSADLYVYSLSSRSIKQLTTGPSQAYQPSWSPDGKYILHAGADTFGTGAGYAMAGVWAARADGSEVKELYKPDSGDEIFVGWVSNSAFLVYSWSASCGPFNLRTFDIETGEVTPVWPGAFFVQGQGSSVAYDPTTGMVLVALDEYTASTSCTAGGQPQKPGLYLTNIRKPSPRYISDVSAFAGMWDRKSNLFFASTEDGAIEVATNGEVAALPAPIAATPVISPDDASWAWTSDGFGDKPAGLWLGPVGQKAPARVFDDAVSYATWSPDSQHLFFFADGGLYVTGRSGERPVLLVDVHSSSGDAQWVMP